MKCACINQILIGRYWKERRKCKRQMQSLSDVMQVCFIYTDIIRVDLF